MRWGEVSSISCTFSFFVLTHVSCHNLHDRDKVFIFRWELFNLRHIFWGSCMVKLSAQQLVGPGCCYSAQRVSWAPRNWVFFSMYLMSFHTRSLLDEYLSNCVIRTSHQKRHLLSSVKGRISKWPTSCLNYFRRCNVLDNFPSKNLDFIHDHMKLMKPVSIDWVWPALTCFVSAFVSIQHVQRSFVLS